MSTNTRPLLINSGTAAIKWSLNLKEIQEKQVRIIKKNHKKEIQAKKYNIVSLKEWLHKQCTLLYRCKDLEFERTCLEFPIITEYHVFSCKRQPFWILTTILKNHIQLFFNIIFALCYSELMIPYATIDNFN